ncbi:hypothetical protein FGB62_51g132 [Gracilaria domingensis]|nr:hypothetical protein FGB62_51g132 [Gracilaria domingensis]
MLRSCRHGNESIQFVREAYERLWLSAIQRLTQAGGVIVVKEMEKQNRKVAFNQLFYQSVCRQMFSDVGALKKALHIVETDRGNPMKVEDVTLSYIALCSDYGLPDERNLVERILEITKSVQNSSEKEVIEKFKKYCETEDIQDTTSGPEGMELLSRTRSLFSLRRDPRVPSQLLRNLTNTPPPNSRNNFVLDGEEEREI